PWLGHSLAIAGRDATWRARPPPFPHLPNEARKYLRRLGARHRTHSPDLTRDYPYSPPHAATPPWGGRLRVLCWPRPARRRYSAPYDANSTDPSFATIAALSASRANLRAADRDR